MKLLGLKFWRVGSRKVYAIRGGKGKGKAKKRKYSDSEDEPVKIPYMIDLILLNSSCLKSWQLMPISPCQLDKLLDARSTVIPHLFHQQYLHATAAPLLVVRDVSTNGTTRMRGWPRPVHCVEGNVAMRTLPKSWVWTIYWWALAVLSSQPQLPLLYLLPLKMRMCRRSLILTNSIVPVPRILLRRYLLTDSNFSTSLLLQYMIVLLGSKPVHACACVQFIHGASLDLEAPSRSLNCSLDRWDWDPTTGWS